MPKNILVIAYRGASAHAPENTVPAVLKAIELGADMVELDVQASSDGVPVCVSDVRLDRVAGDPRRVKKMKAGELGAVDVGARFSEEFKGTGIPALEEILKAAPKVPLMLRLRELPAGTEFEKALKAALEDEKGGRARPTVVEVPDSLAIKRCKDWKSVEWAFAADEKMEGWLLLDKSEKLGLGLLRVYRKQADTRLLRAAEGRSMEVFALTSDEEEDIKELADMGVGGIITGKPDEAKRVLKERKA